VVTLILTLLSHGCPSQAIVAAFGFDERTMAAWLTRAGQHCQRVHQHVVQQGRVDLQPVQADELWVKLVRRGRPRLVLEPGLYLGQVGRWYVQRQVVSVKQRVLRGTAEAIAAVLAATHSGTAIQTAYIERLNATFRSALAALVRRGRAIVHTEAALTAGMWLVGCGYNFCGLHQRLRLTAPPGAPWKWQGRTSAMAAGLTHHRWTRLALLRYQVPLPAWVTPKRRGRPPKRALQPAMAVAA